MGVKAERVSGLRNPWVIIDDKTGEILDDAQGYGYRSAVNAHKAWAYKSMPKKEKRRREVELRHARRFWREHKTLADTVDDAAFIAMKDGDDSFDVKAIATMIAEAGVDTGDLTATRLAQLRPKC